MAATPWIIAKAGIAHLFCIPSPDVAGPCSIIFNLFDKSAGKVLSGSTFMWHLLLLTW